MNTSENIISIVIPTYKGSKTLDKLSKELISVFKNYKMEIVIVNDCSPDETYDVCKNLLKEFPD